jgi:ATP-dependent Clp protease ATP-binding subunit ClpA
MPKVNVYLPDDLADAVKDVGIPVSSVCQRALEHVVRQVKAVGEAASHDLEGDDPIGRPANLTARTSTVLRLAVEAARTDGVAEIGTRHVLRAILDEGTNLAIAVLASLEIEPSRLAEALAAEPAEPAELAEPAEPAEPAAPAAPAAPPAAAGDLPARRMTGTAVASLQQALVESLSLGHNYIGCEHLLLGLVAEPDGAAGRVLRAAGADQRATRRSVVAALSGYVHLQAQMQPAPAPAADAVSAAVQRELGPVTQRLDRIEERLDALTAP